MTPQYLLQISTLEALLSQKTQQIQTVHDQLSITKQSLDKENKKDFISFLSCFLSRHYLFECI
jgi:hypothetical protein